MYRVDNATAAAALPTPAAVGPNPNGYFTKGDPLGGVPATIVDDDWMNAVQEELIAILVAASVTPSKTNRNQVLTALQALFLRTSNFTGSNQSLGNNGFQKLPGGLVLQWGTYTQTAAGTGSSTNAITFPQAFATQCVAIVGISTDAGAFIALQTKSASGATFRNYNRDTATPINAIPAYWFAIGY